MSVKKYHAGTLINNDVTQEQFINDDVQVISAIAFGMGINKPCVCCHVMFKNIEQYYQEIGRVEMDCLQRVIFFSRDVIIQQQFNKDVMDAAVFIKSLAQTIALCHSHRVDA